MKRTGPHPSASLLDRIPGVGPLPPGVGDDLAGHVDVVRPRPGTVLARRGTTAREVIVVLRGDVGVLRDDETVGRIGPGGAFGGHEVVTGSTHPHDYVAGAGVELAVLYGPAFRAARDHLTALVEPVGYAEPLRLAG